MKEKRKYTFIRWFKHWYQFNKLSIKLKVWKPHNLLHDIDKPFRNLVLCNDDVSKLHRLTSKHHLEFYSTNRVNYTDMLIDWECARFTKKDKPLTASLVFMNNIYLSYDVDIDIQMKIAKELKRLNLMKRADVNLVIHELKKLK